MPIYEYECDKCGHHAEVMQKFSDPLLTECENCHGSMRKLISQSSFHLKGSGWYVTDYASKSGSGKTGEKPSDKKPAEKNETQTSTETKGESGNSEKASAAPTEG